MGAKHFLFWIKQKIIQKLKAVLLAMSKFQWNEKLFFRFGLLYASALCCFIWNYSSLINRFMYLWSKNFRWNRLSQPFFFILRLYANGIHKQWLFLSLWNANILIEGFLKLKVYEYIQSDPEPIFHRLGNIVSSCELRIIVCVIFKKILYVSKSFSFIFL